MEKKIIAIIAGISLVVAGIIGYVITRPPTKPTLDEANIILAESIQNTLGLNSFTTTGDGALKIKDGETVLFNVALEDMQISTINPFDFAEQDLSGVFTYSILMNFSAIADFIERVKTPEELGNLRAMLKDMFGIDMDILVIMRELEEANVSATIEMKTIDFDSYIKIVEVEGLREIVRDVVGIPAAEIVMGHISPHLGVWYKMPADPRMREETIAIFKDIEGLMLAFFDIYYVKEVLPNTEINEIPVYNFVLGVDLDGIKDVVISAILLFAEKEGIDIKEKERTIAHIEEYWPKVVKIVEAAMGIDAKIYICQETRFIMRDTITINVNLYEFILALDPIMQAEIEEITPEQEAEFKRMKETVEGISILIIMDMKYRDHNAVLEILPPAEYEVYETIEILKSFFLFILGF